MNLAEGTIIAGRYRLERRLGVGGMGEVWAAKQSVTRMPVALKFLKDADASPHVKRRFLREARAACAVRHPNVVQIHDVLEMEGGAPVMVMELLEGESFEQRLARDRRIALGDLCAIMVRVASAVGTAHAAGIVHRDLKPDNVFLVQTPEGLDVKVLDFGIAKLTALEGNAAETGGLTNTGAMLGTPYYMSPEQAFGERRVDHRADIWSLGIILYRGLSGVLPTQAENIGQILKIIMTNAIRPLAQVAPDLPPDVLDLVARMLEPDPDKRPQSLQDVKAVLERYAGIVVEGFGAPRLVEDPSTISGPGAPAATGGAVSRPAPVDANADASSSGRAKLVLLAVVVIGAAAIAFPLLRGHTHVEAGSTSAPSASTPAADPSAEHRPSEPTTSSAASTAASTAPPPSLTASASSSAPPPSPTVSASAKRIVRTPTSTTSTPSQPPESGKPAMGGVIEKPPF